MSNSLEALTAEELAVEQLGEPLVPNRYLNPGARFTLDSQRISLFTLTSELEEIKRKGLVSPSFEAAGPREKLFFDPSKVTAGIVTCGGLCPGLNDVIRSATLTLRSTYGVKRVLGFRYGYQGITRTTPHPPIELDEDAVEDIQQDGGSILGSSRGPQKPSEMVDCLVEHGVNILLTVGGDGTLRGASDVALEIKKRGLKISVIGIPKTIDNDILCTQTTFGFETAVETAARVLSAAHEEAHAYENGIALVRLMGRESGFITAYATLASNEVNFCLIPEVPLILDGPNSFLSALEKRLAKKKHALIVVAEGAGQDACANAKHEVDASGNPVLQDIGVFLKQTIQNYFKGQGTKISLKYIDPSYLIRSVRTSAFDSIFCLRLAQNAVHAAMAGKTNMLIGLWNQSFSHVPIQAAVHKRKMIDPQERLWQSVLETTGQMKWFQSVK